VSDPARSDESSRAAGRVSREPGSDAERDSREPGSDSVQHSWRVMRDLVLDHDRRHEIADALGLSFARVRALKEIAQDPLTLRELAAQLQTDPPYATRIVDDLEQLGLVARSTDPRDRRAKLVSLTAAGEVLARRARELLDVPPAGLRELPAEELATLARILSRLER
jgi:DNA-binding MarR family transcriptional regulator